MCFVLVSDRAEVEWAAQWSDEKIAAERARDARERERYFRPDDLTNTDAAAPTEEPALGTTESLWQRLKQWLARFFSS